MILRSATPPTCTFLPLFYSSYVRQCSSLLPFFQRIHLCFTAEKLYNSQFTLVFCLNPWCCVAGLSARDGVDRNRNDIYSLKEWTYTMFQLTFYNEIWKHVLSQCLLWICIVLPLIKVCLIIEEVFLGGRDKPVFLLSVIQSLHIHLRNGRLSATKWVCCNPLCHAFKISLIKVPCRYVSS